MGLKWPWRVPIYTPASTAKNKHGNDKFTSTFTCRFTFTTFTFCAHETNLKPSEGIFMVTDISSIDLTKMFLLILIFVEIGQINGHFHENIHEFLFSSQV